MLDAVTDSFLRLHLHGPWKYWASALTVETAASCLMTSGLAVESSGDVHRERCEDVARC